MITITGGKLHWNYFLALERDLEVVARYVEFCEPNLKVYSLELAHLLFAAASEVDVLAKLLCARLQPEAKRDNINDYRTVLVPGIPDLPTIAIFVPRYGLEFKPWENWAGTKNPDWWQSYNGVKHQRDTRFNEATLQNAINALGALMIFTLLYYSPRPENGLSGTAARSVTMQLKPESTLLRLHTSCYVGFYTRPI